MAEYTLGYLAELLNARLCNGDAATRVVAVAPLSEAGKGQLSFLADSKYRKHLATTQASVVLLGEEDVADCRVAALVVDNPAAQFAQVASLFERKICQAIGIHETAVIGSSCVIDASASIGARCVIGNFVTIGKHTKILPGTVIGDYSIIGDDCLFHANVTLYQKVVIGSRVTVHSGAVIGSDGFGNTHEGGKWFKMPQLGRVVIADDVDIGANTTIDCGALGDTEIKQGVKIDNLVQIAHNVQIGEHTAIAAQTGIAGSTKVGAYCMLAGQVGVTGHISICDHVIVSAQSGVSKSLVKPGLYTSHIAAMPHVAWYRKLSKMFKVDKLEKRVIELEKAIEEVKEHEFD